MPIKQELFDEILKDYKKPEDLLGDNYVDGKQLQALRKLTLNQ